MKITLNLNEVSLRIIPIYLLAQTLRVILLVEIGNRKS
jgi:hypothetical protein